MHSIYIGPQYILQGDYTLNVYLREKRISWRELEGISLRRVSHLLKTVTNLSAKCQLLIFSTLFSGLYKYAISLSLLVKGIDFVIL